MQKNGWDWKTAKAQEWVGAVSQRIGKRIILEATLTDYQCNTLARLCELVFECNRIAKNAGVKPDHPICKRIFEKYGNNGKLPLIGWEEMHNTIDQEYMPF
jgi:hypothetical protein